MSRTVRNEADMIAGIKGYARATGRRAKRKKNDMIRKRVDARVERIVEARAQAIASQQTVDTKPDVSWHEAWCQKKWSFL